MTNLIKRWLFFLMKYHFDRLHDRIDLLERTLRINGIEIEDEWE